MSISKFNHNKATFTFKADPDFRYYKLKYLAESGVDPDKVYPLKALYINSKSRYGASPVAVTEAFYVNLPNHLLDDVKSMMADEGIVHDINNGKCGFKIRTYTNKNGTLSYSVEWVDILDQIDAKDLPF